MDLKKAHYKSPGEAGKRGFEDLDCYQMALDLMVNAHEVARGLPVEERYDLVQQIRRASKSVSANIAEGYGRFHYLDTLRFYAIARGSLNETLNHFITARTLDYIEKEYFEQIYGLTRKCEQALNGLMRYVQNQRRGGELYGNRTIQEDSALYDSDWPGYFDAPANEEQ